MLLFIIQCAAFTLWQRFLPFFYVKSSSNLKPNDSFEICLSWGFRNIPNMLNLMKFWLRYLLIKTIQLIPLQNLISSQLLFILQKWSLAFNLAYLSHFFIKFKDQGQFWSLLAWGFWNCHWFWKLMKNWLRYSKLKERLNFWRSNKGWDEIKFWSGINCL